MALHMCQFASKKSRFSGSSPIIGSILQDNNSETVSERTGELDKLDKKSSQLAKVHVATWIVFKKSANEEV